jgi:argininosuccinate lyase
MVVAGMPFRDAIKAVAEQLENGFSISKETKHTHEGSINNLCLGEIKKNDECLLIKTTMIFH